MSGRLLLPPNSVGTPDYEIGAWKDFSRDFPELHNKIEKPTTTQENITSIPSPWARLLLFRDALNPEHKLHQKLTSELLDVLEIIFFRNSIIYNIDFKEIYLNSDQATSNFKSTMCDLNPDKSSFKLIKLFYLKEMGVEQPILLAGSSPYSLFFTPEDKHPKFKRYFKHIRSFNERPEYFRKYIKKLCATVTNKVVNGDRNLSALNDLLSTLVHNEPNTVINFRNEDREILDQCESYTTVSGIDIHSFKYDHIESALKIKSFKNQATPPLVIKNNYRGIYYNNYQFPNEVQDLTDFNNREVLPGEMIKYPWIFPEIDFLEDHIIKVPYDTNDNILVLGNPNTIQNRRTVRYLIPLREKYFEYFEPSDIDKYLTIEENLGKVEITLKIPVQLNDFVEIKKSFFGAEKVIDAKIDDVPYLCIWPKINPDHWKDHYFFIEFQQNNNLGINFLDKDGKELNVSSSNLANTVNSNTIYKTKKSIQNDVYSSANLPDIIQLKINKNQKTFKGMFIIDRKNFGSVQFDESNKAVISFDFGTSNTTVAYQISGLGNTTNLFESKNNSQEMFNYSDFAFMFLYPDEMNSPLQFFLKSLQVFFFPQYYSYTADVNKNEAIIPFSSIISYDKSVNRSMVMLRANIPFYLTWASEELGLLGDLKWQSGDQARELTQIYIEQLLLMVKYFLIKKGVVKNNVTLVWSYPRSFSKNQMTHLMVTWKSLLQNTGYQIKEIDESKASLIYFIKERDFSAYRDTLKVTVDVGGGTSDISVHKGTKNILYASTLIGGNDLIGQKEEDSPLFHFLIQKAEQDTGNNLFIESKFFDNAEYVQIESIQIKFNYIIKKELKSEKLNNLLSGGDFNFGRFILLYFYSIIFYEIGLKLQKVEGKIYPDEFFFGGNGSKFLKWLNFGDWTEHNENIPFFNSILKSAMKSSDDRTFDLKISPKPKSEVAIGSCYAVNDTTQFEENGFDTYQFIGENISLKNNQVSWDEKLSDLFADEFSLSDFSKIELTNLTESNIYKFNNTFFELIKSSNLIELNTDKIINSSLSQIKNDLLDKKLLDEFLRENSIDLFNKTQDIKVSLFVMTAKGCLKQIMKTIRKKM